MGRIGYARVSTMDQDLAEQVAQLKAAGCGIIRSEAASGASRDGRDELATILAFIKAGDELVVQRIDRLGRSTRDVLNIVHELDAKQASLRVLDPEITTTGELGRMAITVLGMVAGMELRFIKERQKAGIAAARARGAYKGGSKKVDDDAIRALLAQGLGKAKVAKQLGISRMTVYRALAQPAARAIESEPVPSMPATPAIDPEPLVPALQPPEADDVSSYGSTVVALILSLEVEINRAGTRGRKRAIADIEEELAAWWDLADETPADGDYAISMELYPEEANEPETLDREIERLIHDLGEIADRRYCYVKATIVDPASGRRWSGIEPAKALRRRRPPRRKSAPSRRKPKSRPNDWGTPLHSRGRKTSPHVIRKGQGSSALYYIDADDRQSAWHGDIGKARRFQSRDDATAVLDILLDDDLFSNTLDDYDIVSL